MSYSYFHGWGFRSDFWHDCVHALSLSTQDVMLYDRGYFQTTIETPLQEYVKPKMIVAHSMGLHFLPIEMIQEVDTVVLLSTFDHFGRREEIDQMIDKMENDPITLLKNFYRRAALPKKPWHKIPSCINAQLLIQDLQLLQNASLDPKKLEALQNKTTIIHGALDRIVALEKAQDLHKKIRGSRLMVLSEMGHLPTEQNYTEIAGLFRSIGAPSL